MDYGVANAYIYIYHTTKKDLLSPPSVCFSSPPLCVFLPRLSQKKIHLKALEALKVAWPLGGQDDAELQERLQRSCRGLEDFTFEAINTSPVEAWKNTEQNTGGNGGSVLGGKIVVRLTKKYRTDMVYDVVCKKWSNKE